MSDVLVREARNEELATAGELTVAAYEVDGFLRHASGETYAEVLRDTARRAEHADLFVAVDESATVLGTVTLVTADSVLAQMCVRGEAELRMLAVASAGRWRGVGEALTRGALDRAREHGAERMVLASQPEMTAAHRLYTRLGFRRAPQRDWNTDSGVPLIAFTCAL